MINPAKEFLFENIQLERDSIRATLAVSPALPYLKGHFPDLPILPGVAMLDAVWELIKGHTPEAECFSLDSGKFLSPVGPETQVEIEGTFSRKDSKPCWSFYWREKTSAQPLGQAVFILFA